MCRSTTSRLVGGGGISDMRARWTKNEVLATAYALEIVRPPHADRLRAEAVGREAVLRRTATARLEAISRDIGEKRSPLGRKCLHPSPCSIMYEKPRRRNSSETFFLRFSLFDNADMPVPSTILGLTLARAERIVASHAFTVQRQLAR